MVPLAEDTPKLGEVPYPRRELTWIDLASKVSYSETVFLK